MVTGWQGPKLSKTLKGQYCPGKGLNLKGRRQQDGLEPEYLEDFQLASSGEKSLRKKVKSTVTCLVTVKLEEKIKVPRGKAVPLAVPLDQGCCLSLFSLRMAATPSRAAQAAH